MIDGNIALTHRSFLKGNTKRQEHEKEIKEKKRKKKCRKKRMT